MIGGKSGPDLDGVVGGAEAGTDLLLGKSRSSIAQADGQPFLAARLFDACRPKETVMDALVDRPERDNMFATVMAVRLQSLVEILPDGLPNTTTIALAAGKLRTHPAWRGSLGQRLCLDYMEKAVGKLVKAHPDLIGSKFKVRHRGILELRIWRQQSLKP
jgi:hypothetical protein